MSDGRPEARACLCTKSSVGKLRAAERPGAALEVRIVGGGRTVTVRGRRLTVGSSPRNDLALPGDPYITRHHCTLLVEDDGVWIQDEASHNGTWVNNVRVERCRVAPGARITVGHTVLHLQTEGQAAEAYGIVGGTMERVVAQIERFAPTMRPVLIQGETGTGKELVARAIHAASPSAMAVFEALNCGAIPRDLAEAELFGHAEGAFTGACRARRGAFERADGGTLFLDEVGEMARELQPKLLRVLEEGVVRPLGDEQRRVVDVRLISATHRDLLGEISRGAFRLDLYHRLAVGIITLPPLRDRPEDIPPLVQHFIAREVIGRGPRAMPCVTERAMDFLREQPWPGNVRQLRHAVQLALMEGGAELDVEHFDSVRNKEWGERLKDYVRFRGRPFVAIRDEVYRRVIEEHGGNHTAAAAALGIPKSTFFDQLRAMRSAPGGGGVEAEASGAVLG